MQGFLWDFAICPQWGASLSCSGQTNPFSSCSLPALLLFPIRGGGEEPHGNAGCPTCWRIHAARLRWSFPMWEQACTGADWWPGQPSKWSPTLAISRHWGKSNERTIMYTYLILSESSAVFSSEISCSCCCLISSLLWIFLLITSTVFPWVLWIAPTPSFVTEGDYLMHGTTPFCLFCVLFLLPYWIACFFSKNYGFLYPHNTTFFPDRTVLIHTLYRSYSLHLTAALKFE